MGKCLSETWDSEVGGVVGIYCHDDARNTLVHIHTCNTRKSNNLKQTPVLISVHREGQNNHFKQVHSGS